MYKIDFTVYYVYAISDYPFVLREVPSGKVVDLIENVSAEDKQKMLGDNAVKFLGLKKADYVKELTK